MAVDPVWAGVVGTAVGAVAGSATSLLAPLINWRTESRKLDKQHRQALELLQKEREAESERIEAQVAADERSVKRDTITTWRDGIAELLVDYKAHLRENLYYLDHYGEPDVEEPVQPTVGGQRWFETLRPHLRITEVGHDRIAIDPSFMFSESVARVLSDEVSRIEREWKLV